jgi:hypothetical protein
MTFVILSLPDVVVGTVQGCAIAALVKSPALQELKLTPVFPNRLSKPRTMAFHPCEAYMPPNTWGEGCC